MPDTASVTPGENRSASRSTPVGLGIRYRGSTYRARKTFWRGTQRTIAPADTLERIRPHFPRIGLTRLANITGLDRIGIPTVLAVRPSSGILAADAGKGFTLEAAMTSAAMECIERYHGEFARVPEFSASYDATAERHAVIPIERLALTRYALFSRRRPERWTLGWDLIGQREVAVPTLAVTMQRHCAPRSELLTFQSSSNGLSAGNNFAEAVLGGLLEIVERDAVACWRIAADRGGASIPRIRPETITHPEARELLDRFREADVSVALFDCTIDTRVPVCMAYVYDNVRRHVGVYRGYGAHLDPGIAMVRAMTEALQGRVIYFAGSRDDFFRHDYLRLKQHDDAAAVRSIAAVPPTIDACSSSSSRAHATFEEDVHEVLAALQHVGLRQVIVHDLTMSEFDVSVVRVMCPGLEGYLFDFYSPGPRARAFLQEHLA